MARPLLLALLAAVAEGRGAAAATEACRAPAEGAEAPGLLLVQAKPPGLSRLQPALRAEAALVGAAARAGGRSGDDDTEVSCAFGANVTITSHRLQQLQDNEGLLNLYGGKNSWEQFKIEDAGNGKVKIVSLFGRYLSDDSANPVLIDEGHEAAEWRISYAGNGQFFLTSHRNEHLGDWEGVLTMHGNMGGWEKWYINTLDMAPACTSPKVAADELASLRSRAQHAEDLLFQAREILAADCSTTTTTPPDGNSPFVSRCAIFGDPHFITFDGGHTTFVGDRIIWVVRSNHVWMQAISRDATGNFMGFAVGGPFMNGHMLVVYNASDGGPLRAEFDGSRILEELNDEFHAEDIGVRAWRSESWDAAMHDSKILELRTEGRFDIGPWPERFLGSPEGGLFLLRLPGNIEVTITGVDFMSAVVTMPAQDQGQSGYCGNFNGDPEDDYEEVAPSWNRPVGADLGPVASSMNLFKRMDPHELKKLLSFLGTGAGADPGQEGHVADCPPERKALAEEQCKAVDDLRLRQDCVFDICRTGARGVVQGMLATEVLDDKVNAQGAVAFMGHGRCLDANGRRYAAFATKEVKTEAACKQLLKEMAFTKGVLGAELHRTSSCMIVVDSDAADLTATVASGRWLPGGKLEPTGPAGEALPSGSGIISGTTTDAAWSCWTAI